MILNLLIEDAGPLGSMVHAPSLPGHSFRVPDIEHVESIALAATREYVRHLHATTMEDLNPAVEALVAAWATGDAFRFQVAEHVPGAPVWESGNAAVLFEWDRQGLSDADVHVHLRFLRRTLDEIRECASAVSHDRLRERPRRGRRSIDETLEHIGNCVWWYCSRIDDELPEPIEPPGEDPLDRINRLLDGAEAFLSAIPLAERATIHVPTRFPTKNPNEPWTHTKAFRRQAEHAWAHLRGLRSTLAEMEKE